MAAAVAKKGAEGFTEDGEKHVSILKRLVKESIVAYPDEAHLKILDFLTESGMDEEKTLKFRQCWSKVVMGTQAFGRKKNAKETSIPNPDLFADELIRELSYGDRDITNLIDAMVSSGDLDDINESSENPHEILKNLQKFNIVNRKLIDTIQDLNGIPSSSTDNAAADESLLVNQCMALFRNSMKGTKLHWKSSKTIQVPYYPLDKTLHGDPESYHGSIAIPVKHEHKEMPLYLSTTELQGLRVTNTQPCYQERAWSAYQCLNELLATQSLNMFPIPINAHRESHSLSLLLAFEALPMKQLSTLQGPVLSTFLRKYPSIVSLWAGQLACAYHSLQYHCSGSLIKSISLTKDVFVRENGMLLLGNLGFNDSVPKKLNGPHSVNKNASDFLLMACKLLASSLCLSRTESVTLQDASHIFPEEDLDYRTKFSSSLSTEINEHLFAIVVGSTLELNVLGHNCTSVNVMAPRTVSSESSRKMKHEAGNTKSHFDADEVERENQSAFNNANNTTTVVGSSVLIVKVQSEHAGVASVSNAESVAVNKKTSKGLSVNIHGIKAGVISLVLSVTRSDDSSSTLRPTTTIVRVVVIPNYPTQSVEVLELIGFLEEYHTSRIPSSILNAQIFAKPRLEKLKTEVSSDNTDNAMEYYRQHNLLSAAASSKRQSFQSDWSEITRAINRLGTQNLADATLTSGATSNVGGQSVLLKEHK